MGMPHDALAPYPWSCIFVRGVCLRATDVEVSLPYGPVRFGKDFA